MHIIHSRTLGPDARQIREDVFVREQGFQNEFDEIDEIAYHFTLYEDNTPIAVCRLYPGDTPGEFIVGRIAIRREFRGRHLGQALLTDAEQFALSQGGRKLSLSAQVRVRPFYEACGYRATGEPYLDEFCSHIHMEKQLNGSFRSGCL